MSAAEPRSDPLSRDNLRGLVRYLLQLCLDHETDPILSSYMDTEKVLRDVFSRLERLKRRRFNAALLVFMSSSVDKILELQKLEKRGKRERSDSRAELRELFGKRLVWLMDEQLDDLLDDRAVRKERARTKQERLLQRVAKLMGVGPTTVEKARAARLSEQKTKVAIRGPTEWTLALHDSDPPESELLMYACDVLHSHPAVKDAIARATGQSPHEFQAPQRRQQRVRHLRAMLLGVQKRAKSRSSAK